MGGTLAFLLKHGVGFDKAVSVLKKCRLGKGVTTQPGKDPWIDIFCSDGGQSFKDQVKLMDSQLKTNGLQYLRTEIIRGYITDPGWTVC